MGWQVRRHQWFGGFLWRLFRFALKLLLVDILLTVIVVVWLRHAGSSAPDIATGRTVNDSLLSWNDLHFYVGPFEDLAFRLVSAPVVGVCLLLAFLLYTLALAIPLIFVVLLPPSAMFGVFLLFRLLCRFLFPNEAGRGRV